MVYYRFLSRPLGVPQVVCCAAVELIDSDTCTKANTLDQARRRLTTVLGFNLVTSRIAVGISCALAR